MINIIYPIQLQISTQTTKTATTSIEDISAAHNGGSKPVIGTANHTRYLPSTATLDSFLLQYLPSTILLRIDRRVRI
jgi:hypothetical protein